MMITIMLILLTQKDAEKLVHAFVTSRLDYIVILYYQAPAGSR